MPGRKRGTSFRAAPGAEAPAIKKRARRSSVQPDVEAKVRKLSDRPRSPAIFKLEQILQPLDQRTTGQVFTLGDNMTGQLGFSTDDVESKKRPALVDGLSDIVSVCCGGMHTVCLTKSGEVITFGCNDDGALGRNTSEEGTENKPTKVELPAKAIQVSAGDSHSAALLEDGRVFAWGTYRDSSGLFGLTMSGKQKEELPVEMLAGQEIIKISSGDDHLVMLSTGGLLYTVGNGEQGQLGRVTERTATNKDSRHHKQQLLIPAPIDLHAHRRASSKIKCSNVWTGSWTTMCQSEADNKIYVCGLNNYQQIGLTEINNPQYMPVLSQPMSIKKWKQLCGGQHHTLCLDEDGVVYSLGRHDYGRLGHGEDGQTLGVPTPISALEGIKCVEIACGNCVSFAISEEGKVYSWGMGSSSQLGIGGSADEDPDDVWKPQLMQGKSLEKKLVVSVAAGGQHTALAAKPSESA